MIKNGIYIHLPYCRQRCHYCDFATVLTDYSVGQDEYLNIVLQEIKNRNRAVPFRKVSTLYFGGGTPSLSGPARINALIQALRDADFDFSSLEEATVEINPGTLTVSDLREYVKMGITRFSLGVQTFNRGFLENIGREHTLDETFETLEIFRAESINYTLDLLFTLPHQTISDLRSDLEEISKWNPCHVSGYSLTVPKQHPMSKNRASEEDQVKMFYLVSDHLESMGLRRYEISNFSRPGYESQHNLLYWNDQSYWGLGMSAHSYFKNSQWGQRFWNPPHIVAYRKQVEELGQVHTELATHLPSTQYETLQQYQALTDYCHTQLRKTSGLSESGLKVKFSPKSVEIALGRLNKLEQRNLLIRTNDHWRLSRQSLVISDSVYQEMTFLSKEL